MIEETRGFLSSNSTLDGGMKVVVTGVVVGLLAGLVGALCGVGGGILMVPAFVAVLQMKQQEAVATSLAVVVVTALVGTSNHVVKQTGFIDWRLVLFTAVGAAVAAWFGTDLMRMLSNQVLTRIFGILLVLIGARMLFLKA